MEDNTRRTLRSFVYSTAPKMDQQYLNPSQQIFCLLLLLLQILFYYSTTPEDVAWHLMFHHCSA